MASAMQHLQKAVQSSLTPLHPQTEMGIMDFDAVALYAYYRLFIYT